MKKKRILLVIIILIIIFILCWRKKENIFQDDLIFFEAFGISQKNNSISNDKIYYEMPEYVFNVKYNNTNFKEINLQKTINPNTLVKEKIAPGTEGNFQIVLKTTYQKIKYEVNFASENAKPQNLKFSEGDDGKFYDSLEELGKNLKGTLNSNQEKIIKINWKWEYDVNKRKDIEDTKDGSYIDKYDFKIYVIGQS